MTAKIRNEYVLFNETYVESSSYKGLRCGPMTARMSNIPIGYEAEASMLAAVVPELPPDAVIASYYIFPIGRVEVRRMARGVVRYLYEINCKQMQDKYTKRSQP